MKILIAIDDSDCSLAALNSVADRTWPEGSEFRVITVIEPIYTQYGYPGICLVDSTLEVEHQLTDYCRKLINAKVAQLQAQFGQDKVTGKLFEGNVAESIIDHAQQWEADLIVVGSHGRKGLQRFFLGSVAEKVVSHAPCSVEIIREKTAFKNVPTAKRELPLERKDKSGVR